MNWNRVESIRKAFYWEEVSFVSDIDIQHGSDFQRKQQDRIIWSVLRNMNSWVPPQWLWFSALEWSLGMRIFNKLSNWFGNTTKLGEHWFGGRWERGMRGVTPKEIRKHREKAHLPIWQMFAECLKLARAKNGTDLAHPQKKFLILYQWI